MKCYVTGCKYNKNNACSNLAKLGIVDSGNSVICGTYKESIDSKRNKYTMNLYKNYDLGNILMIMYNTCEGLSSCWDLIIKDIQKMRNTNNKIDYIIIDLTLKNGTRASNRYLELSINGHLNYVTKHQGYTKNFIDFLKLNTCNYLKEHSELLKNSILNTIQIKMINKGIAI